MCYLIPDPRSPPPGPAAMSDPTPTQSHDAPADALLRRLKADTAALHAAIEQVVPLMRPELDLGGYRAYLGRLLGYLEPLEDRLAAFAPRMAPFGLDFEARRKVGLLRGDLRHLGLDEAAQRALPRCAALPAAGGLEEAWGCLYVLEGSTLGGQIIQRALGPRLGLSPAAGLAFLVGYGAQTGTSWRAFAAATQRLDEAGCDRGAVLRGAREAFETQMAWLAGGGEGGHG